jgi:hypothetical protein
MKRFLAVFITTFIFMSILSCNQSGKAELRAISGSFADSTLTWFNRNIGDSMAFSSELGERRFIRTADLKFKVSEVEDAVSNIEFKSGQLGGFVSFSHLQTFVQDSAVIDFSTDTSIQLLQYGKVAVLTVRVPDCRLDSFLNHLNNLSDIMLNREISSEDVRVRMLANRLTYRRASKTNQRLTADIDQKGRKLPEIEQVEKILEEKNEITDNANISNLTLDDAVHFSTVSIEIYQDPVKVYRHIVREKAIIAYQKPFLSQISESISFGWQMVEDIIIVIAKYWSLFFFLVVGYFISMKLFRVREKLNLTGIKNK